MSIVVIEMGENFTRQNKWTKSIGMYFMKCNKCMKNLL